MSQRTSGSGDDDIADRSQAPDEAAIASAFREYYQPLCRYTFRRVRQQDIAEDLVQAVFVDLWEHRERREISGTLRSYLYAAVRHRLISHYRGERVRESYADHVAAIARTDAELSDWYLASARAETSELRQRVLEAVAALPPRGREAFELSRIDRLSYAEIASAMGVSARTVQEHLARALRSLREALGPYLTALLLLTF